VAKLAEAGMIEVAAKISNGDLVLSVQDNGPGYRPESGVGVGLANTRARLETLFGDAGQLQVFDAESGGTIATVRFPLRRRSDG
jgi:two-component system, LytTR family, sensor kinase